MAVIETLSSESARAQLRHIMDEILQVDSELVRFVGIFDTKENCIMTKMQKGKTSFLSQMEEENFVLKLKNMKRMQDEFDHLLGRVSLMRIRRERLTQLVYFAGSLIIWATTEPMIHQLKLDNISNYIEIIIRRDSVI